MSDPPSNTYHTTSATESRYPSTPVKAHSCSASRASHLKLLALLSCAMVCHFHSGPWFAVRAALVTGPYLHHLLPSHPPRPLRQFCPTYDSSYPVVHISTLHSHFVPLCHPARHGPFSPGALAVSDWLHRPALSLLTPPLSAMHLLAHLIPGSLYALCTPRNPYLCRAPPFALTLVAPS